MKSPCFHASQYFQMGRALLVPAAFQPSSMAFQKKIPQEFASSTPGSKALQYLGWEISKFEISLMSPIFTGSHRYKNHPFTSLSPYPSWGKKRKMWKRSEVSVARWVAVFAKTTSEFSMFQQNLEKLKFWRRKKWKKKLSKSIPSIYLDYNKFNHPWQASLTFSRWCNLMALVSIASEIGKSQFP